MKLTMRTFSLGLIVGLVILFVFLAMQASAKNRNNPPVLSEPVWDSLETRALAKRACFDCHSNETQWPLYSALPVVGGLLEKHVIDARKELNFSDWNGREQESEEAAEKVFEPMHYAENDPFPQPPYSLFHPKARLSQTERERLANGLVASLGADGFATNQSDGDYEHEEGDDD